MTLRWDCQIKQSQDFRLGVFKLDESLFDLGDQRFKSGKVMQVGVVLFDFLPQFFNRVEVGRIGRQLMDREAVGLSRKKLLHGLAGMIFGTILDEDDGTVGLVEDLFQKRLGGGGSKPLLSALVKQAPGKIVDQAKDFVPFALAGGGNGRLLAAPRPGIGKSSPLGKRGFIAKEQPRAGPLGLPHQVPARFGAATSSGPLH